MLFGVTGDLAYKKIFPALYAMVKQGSLDVPIIGVASSPWDITHLRGRVAEAVKHSGKIDDQPALDRLLSLFRYVSGNYNNPETFKVLKQAMGNARRPVHYLAIPPALFAIVIKNLGAAGLAGDARVIVEKPFGRDLASARKLNHVARGAFRKIRFSFDHFLGRSDRYPLPPLRHSFLEPIWNRTI